MRSERWLQFVDAAKRCDRVRSHYFQTHRRGRRQGYTGSADRPKRRRLRAVVDIMSLIGASGRASSGPSRAHAFVSRTATPSARQAVSNRESPEAATSSVSLAAIAAAQWVASYPRSP